jgi:ankyrin repeat protein
LGDSPLLLSAQEGHITTFLILTSLGANRFIRNEKDETGLHSAAYGGYPDIAGLYIDEYGVDIDIKDNDSETALMKVCKGGVTDIYRLFLLIQTMKRSDLGVSQDGLIEANNRIVKMFDYLIKKGANVNIKNNEGETTLMLAAKFGNTFMVGKLISLGVDVNVLNNNNENALDYAKKEKNTATAELIQLAMAKK